MTGLANELSGYPVDMANKLTGIRIDETLKREVGAMAALDGKRFSTVVEEALRLWVSSRRSGGMGKAVDALQQRPVTPAVRVATAPVDEQSGRRYDYEDV
jgi:hypothetical protein